MNYKVVKSANVQFLYTEMCDARCCEDDRSTYTSVLAGDIINTDSQHCPLAYNFIDTEVYPYAFICQYEFDRLLDEGIIVRYTDESD